MARLAALIGILWGLAAVLPAAETGGGAPALPTEPGTSPPPLLWDVMEKTIDAQPGEGISDFAFTVTNTSDKPVTIYQLRPTCGCTVAEMPASPWVISPGKTGTFVGTIDFRGQMGTVTKSIFVNSTAGTQRLAITVNIPTLDENTRKQNQIIAQRDRQAVFSGECVKCHLTPARNLSGAELFTAACGVCHFSTRRSSIVPNLLTARQHRDAGFWRKWISEGKDGTLMPAWSKQHGGPLTDEQIESLVKFALETLPTQPPTE